MNVIVTYLDAMFSPYPQTTRMLEAKSELHGMMEDAYNALLADGRSENEAIGQVISDFGNLDELAPVLGIASELKPGAPTYGTSDSLGQGAPAQVEDAPDGDPSPQEASAPSRPGKKKGDEAESPLVGVIAGFYWPAMVAVFLAWSFIGNAWHISWIMWPIGAAVFGAIAGGLNAYESYRNKRR